MSKILMIYRHFADDPEGIGVSHKMWDQKKGFEQLGYSVDAIHLSSKGIMINKENMYEKDLKNDTIKKVFGHFKFYQILITKKVNVGYDYVYIRYGLAGSGLVRFLKANNRNSKPAKVVIEFPTFPYENEYQGLMGKSILLLDSLFRHKLSPLTNYAVDFGAQQEIYGVPCINISNGINLERIKEVQLNYSEKSLRMIALGKLWNWFGLDRLIKGMHEYYYQTNNVEVTLKIVGEGPEKGKLKQMVSKYNLSSKVEFLGMMTGKELDNLFDHSDLAIGTMAIHRKGVKHSSSLKHREYFARMMPFVYSGTDNLFNEKLPGILTIDENEDPVDINRLISFMINSDPLSLAKRKKVVEKLSWNHELKKVIDQLTQVNDLD